MKKTIIFIATFLYSSYVIFAQTPSESVDVSINRAKLVSSYGQLSVSSQDITFGTADSWVVIPFSSSGPTLHMDASTTSPAKITINKPGTYQLNASFYFSVENSHEGTFDTTTYTLGISINDGDITPVASVYASDPTSFSLNYNTLMHFSKHDTIKFYMKASVLGFGVDFSNIVTLNNGNANLVKIL